MYLYDTLSGTKKLLTKPRGGAPLRLFVCGPTVYDSPHLGHARTYVAFDVIVRILRARGFGVVFLENVTNVDDKIIARARERKEDPFALAARYEREFTDAMRAFGVASVDAYARASDFIPAIVAQVAALVRKGYAYVIEGDGYYFDIAKFPEYGRLSRRTALQAEDSVSRIDESVAKRTKGDFCLWKFVQDTDAHARPPKLQRRRGSARNGYVLVNGEPAWETPLGLGRPGWHIEDTAITETFFGPQYDIHGGGLDLKFPHHEAEIAQQEAASGKRPLVRFWMHAGTLLVNGRKMSKSLGNFVTTEEYLSGYGLARERAARVFRLLVLQYHYRSPMDFSDELVLGASRAYASLELFLGKLAFIARRAPADAPGVLAKGELDALEKGFWGRLEDDCNTPEALAGLFRAIGGMEPKVWRLGKVEAAELRARLGGMLEMLGLAFPAPARVPAAVAALAKERELCRVRKQFVQADALRTRIQALGYEVDDTPLGPLVREK